MPDSLFHSAIKTFGEQLQYAYQEKECLEGEMPARRVVFEISKPACHLFFPTRTFECDGENTYLHGQRDSLVRNATLVPLTDKLLRSQGSLSDVVHRVTLYSDLSVFTLPLRLRAESVEEFGTDLYPNASAYNRVSSINKTFFSLIESGRAIFLPQHLEESFLNQSRGVKYEYATPIDVIVSDPVRDGYFRITPSDSAKAQVVEIESFLAYQNILLPYYPDMSFDNIALIRDSESESFSRFLYFLRRKLRELKDVNRCEAVREITEEIEYEVNRLKLEAKRISKLRSMQGVSIGFFAISLATLLLSDGAIAKQIGGVVGSTSAYNVIRDLIAYSGVRNELKHSDFYAPYLIADAHGE